MSLNIKNERTHALVRELAELTGQSQTSAVEDAVRRRLEELRGEADREERIERLLADLKKARDEFGPIEESEDWDPRGDFLYDAYGVPK
ncbi:antitoxin [Microlunatus elymi]|uniref:Antitoxin n=1 Tax=Microlunatus elymi TaxID=2596828 RepID=A0A516PZ36_9ACTN|nr:type II toxin-antitoxin system VapB family antitoxin [Microlunatus elymi]QDP96428.1 antitoxin [Microlunatus elymi]